MRPAVAFGVFIITIAVPFLTASASVFPVEVRDLSDPEAVFAVLRANDATELPAEALAFYLEGIEAEKRGEREKAIEYLELAVLLDPAFPEAYLARARFQFFSDPKAAVEDLWRAVQASLLTFSSQHLLLTNIVLGLLVLAAVGLVILVGYGAIQHFPRVHHSIREFFGLWFGGHLAGLLAVVVMLTPALWRVGMVPLSLAFLGIMWPWMRRGERRWAATLAGVVIATPLVLWGLSPLLYSPLDPAERPFLLGRSMGTAYSSDMARALRTSLESHPEDANLHFAAAMVYRRGGFLDRAEGHYLRALELGAERAAVQNNLGVVFFLRGDYDMAIEILQESIKENPDRAASHFNLSQTFAKKLYFEKADQELEKANSLSFDRIRDALRHTEGDARQTMIDEPLPPLAFWKSAITGPRFMPGVPSWMSLWFAGSLWLLSPIAIIAFAFAHAIGRRLHQNLPSSGCTNCGRPICRRCVRRVRRETYCAHCGDVLLRIQSTSYSKLVLDSQIRRRRVATVLHKVTSWVLPGLHAARVGRPTLAAVLALLAAIGILGYLQGTFPVPRLAWIDNGPDPWWPEAPLTLVAVVMLISWISVAKLKVSSLTKKLGNAPDEPEEEPPAAEEIINAA